MTPPRLLDVRQQSEFDIVHLEDGELLNEEKMEDVLREWDRETLIVCYCHHGIRSLHATVALKQQGFTNVRSLQGGIDHWAEVIDPSLPRY